MYPFGVSAVDPGCLLYLGALSTPSGERRLVNLTFDRPAFICGAKRPFDAQTMPTGMSFRRYDLVASRSSADFDFSDLRPLKLFPAQRDPQDPSLLTFKYELGLTDGLIDARLQNDGTMVFARRK